MTIALGILATDGVVIAADTEETDDYVKHSQQKIVTVLNGVKTPSGACAMAGAGDAGYIDALTEQLSDVFLDDRERVGAPLQQALQRRIHKFHVDHIFPFAAAAERPSVQLLIATQRKFTSGLLVSHESTIRKAIPYKAIGAGAPLATALLARLWAPHCDVRVTQVLATYIAFVVKEQVPSCGKFTNVVTLHGPSSEDTPAGARLHKPEEILTHLSFNEVNELERLFRRWYAPYEHANWWKFIGKYVKVSEPTIRTLTNPSDVAGDFGTSDPLIPRRTKRGR